MKAFLHVNLHVSSRENFAQIDIFYKSMTYSEITHAEAFPFISLLNQVGGFMGLLLGASCLTLVEIIDHLLTLAWRKTTLKQKQKQTRAAESDNPWMKKQEQKKAKAEAWVKMQQRACVKSTQKQTSKDKNEVEQIHQPEMHAWM